jgi:hypothetical protein
VCRYVKIREVLVRSQDGAVRAENDTSGTANVIAQSHRTSCWHIICDDTSLIPDERIIEVPVAGSGFREEALDYLWKMLLPKSLVAPQDISFIGNNTNISIGDIFDVNSIL